MGILGDLLSGAAGLAGTIYNIKTNQRDFDYQKALQQQIFEREDTAVQRRVEDLKAAGLNPALANGSAANAGSVVARSNTNDVNFGSALDTMSALQQIKNQKIQNENDKKQGEILDNEKYKQNMELTLDKMNLFNQLGIDYGVKPEIYKGKNGENGINYIFRYVDGDYALNKDMPFYKLFEYQNNYNKNAADIIQKQNDWFNTNEILSIGSRFLPSLKYSH